MTAPPVDLVAYHVGIVVRELDGVMGLYQRMLGIEHWRMRGRQQSRMPWDARSTDGRLKVAFGRAGGHVRVLQPLEGRTPHMDFLEKHGDGVQHIGFWTPDVRAAVENAVKEGGQDHAGAIGPTGNAEVQLSPGAGHGGDRRMLPTDRMAYVDPGTGRSPARVHRPLGRRRPARVASRRLRHAPPAVATLVTTPSSCSRVNECA